MDRKHPWRLALAAALAWLVLHAQAMPPTEALAMQLRAAAAPAAPAGRRVEISVGALDPRLKLAPCAKIEPVIPPAAKLWGRVRVAMRCVEGARWQVWLPVTVQVFGTGVVARRALPAGAAVDAADLAVAEVDLTADPQGMLESPLLAAGRTLARPLAAGQAVGHADLRSRQWFAAGDTVQVVAVGNGFAIGGVGQAVSPGIEGQVARVRVEGGRLLTGKPVADRRIEVSL
jgi:flagella basal body P-ring formation protein FlgA